MSSIATRDESKCSLVDQGLTRKTTHRRFKRAYKHHSATVYPILALEQHCLTLKEGVAAQKAVSWVRGACRKELDPNVQVAIRVQLGGKPGVLPQA